MTRWFLSADEKRVIGACTDGRTFSEPTETPKAWIEGFKTCCNMHGIDVEVREAK
jgi:hypothetical protein